MVNYQLHSRKEINIFMEEAARMEPISIVSTLERGETKKKTCAATANIKKDGEIYVIRLLINKTPRVTITSKTLDDRFKRMLTRHVTKPSIQSLEDVRNYYGGIEANFIITATLREIDKKITAQDIPSYKSHHRVYFTLGNKRYCVTTVNNKLGWVKSNVRRKLGAQNVEQ